MNLVSQRWLNRTAALLTLAIAIPAQGWYERYIYENQLNPITREGFYWVNYLGGDVDEYGFYQQPVRTTDAFSGELPNGWNRAPMAWDDQGNAVLYYVHNGYIMRQDYDVFQ